jgi:hypothetical protein
MLLTFKPGDLITGVARKIKENREMIRRIVKAIENGGYVEYIQALTIVNTAAKI